MSIKSKKVVLYTGNILDNEELVRKVGQTTMEELRTCVKSTLNIWNKADALLSSDEIEIRGNSKPSLVQDNSSNELKTTVKIFLSSNDAQNLNDAINSVRQELAHVHIDSLIVIPPDVSDDLSMSDLEPVWLALEAFVEKGFISNIGIADLSPNLFKELYHWSKVKPSIIQVNLSSCCTVSEELSDFASHNDVQILTHSDDPEVIDEDTVGAILSRIGMTGAQCEVLWLARHRCIQLCYGLVADKGYSLALGVEV